MELKDATDNVKNYLQEYIEFYRSIVEPDYEDVDKADDRNYYDQEFLSEPEERNTLLDYDLHGYDQHGDDLHGDDQQNYFHVEHHGRLYRPAADHYNWEVLEEDNVHVGGGGAVGYHAGGAEEADGAWQPELEELDIAMYDMEPDWTPQPEVPLERSSRLE